MKIIVSPAKTMRVDYKENLKTPYFINNAKEIRDYLKSLDKDKLKSIWKCNDKIVSSNIELLNTLELDKNLTRAIYAYDGLQFKNLDILSLDKSSLDYLDDNLFILSAMYGALRVNDGVIMYRLEMQSRLNINEHKNMYSYWGSKIYDYISRDDKTIINLASKEYSEAISPYIGKDCNFITISFGSIKDGRLITKSTESKIMRGRILRYLAQNKITNPDDIKSFRDGNMHYSEEYSSPNHYIFVV